MISDPKGILSFLALSLLAYGCGSLPFGFWLSRLLGGPQDIRAHGSGSTGATNVLRFSGKTTALLTVILDIAKAYVPVLVAFLLKEPFAPLIGFFAVLGHVFPVFLSFKGGKGVASTLGVLFVFSWSAALILLAFWGICVLATRYVSLASLATALLAPLLFLGEGDFFPFFTVCLLSLLLFWTHRKNFRRLLKGEEPKLGQSVNDT